MTAESTIDRDRSRAKRILWIVASAAVIELALYLVGVRAPVMRGLTRPLYPLVAVVTLVTLWHTLRRRRGHDRRHADRRSPRAGEPS